MGKLTGLTDRQVSERRASGLTNVANEQSSRSWGDILRSNIVTPFNALITALAVVVILVNKNPINSLFFITMLLNIVVGIGQEVKVKLTLDRLAIMVKPRAEVIRNGVTLEVASSEVVQDDLIVLKAGDQVVVDGVVIETSGLEVDESLLTGESDPILKKLDNEVLSGSIVTAGRGIIRATNVGNASYAAKLTNEAQAFKRASSELVTATNVIMRWIARLMIVIVPLLIIGQLRVDSDWREVVIHTVAAVVGMIPEGLVLLTSAAFMLAAVKLARQKVLVQQLPAVETLARVDTLLLDKTGTITEGQMEFDKLIQLTDEMDEEQLASVLATIASRQSSPTNDALARYFSKPVEFTAEVPLSSSRKWSAIQMAGRSYLFGAPEIVLAGMDDELGGLATARQLATKGSRVLALVELSEWLNDKAELVKYERQSLALVVLAEKIRPDAAQTLDFFARQGVDVKVISGDSPQTVGAIASRVGLHPEIFDARNLPDATKQPREFLRIVKQHNVFGRVLPEQKRQIAMALQGDGRVVAMTGDGVNDALALKKADLGIAMSSGTTATKAVAEVVLMDNKFSHLPAVLGEGRRVAANIERVSNLFIIKNVYVAVLALASTTLGLTYPFLPAQMTVISTLSIGIPAFFLALAPNNRRYQTGFLRRVLSFAIPAGLIMAVAMIVGYYIVNRQGMSLAAAGTSTSIIAMVIGLAILIYLARPIRGWKLLLILACGGLFAAYVSWPPLARVFNLELVVSTLPITFAVAATAIITITLVVNAGRKNK
ncbi:MAG: HAD-IC family P-type ATPase [Candidatus Saccharibacteria bacterium]|nr:HAD-IC family P-type ATPase [Candidatus Saccharibacteria bacterium]